MEVIPVLYLSSKFKKQGTSTIHIKEVMKKERFTTLYVVDERGIRKNEPQYEFYQRFSALYDLWVDTGPRDIGDVVDDIFSGAKTIIIREGLWRGDSLASIRELTGHDIFLALHVNKMETMLERQPLFDDADGFILFVTEPTRMSFFDESEINRLIEKKPVYVFDSVNNERQWRQKEVKGLLQDITTYL